MIHIILVHGMNATSQSWNTITDDLKDSAESVKAVQLPGHDNKISFWSLPFKFLSSYTSDLTVDDYVKEVIKQFPAGNIRNVCLIGHSLGGKVISHVASRHPERISKLIYVAAMLPDQGNSAGSIIRDIKADPTFSALKAALDFWPHRSELQFVKQPREPLAAKFDRTPEFDALKKSYVRTTKDDVIPISIQDAMLAAYSTTITDSEIRTLDQSHIPQFDNPSELLQAIKDLLPS